MTPLPVAEMESIDIDMDCIACKGTGSVTKTERQITKGAMAHHQAKHAYAVAQGGNWLKDLPIGADCDCPRRNVTVTRKCAGCSGKGRRVYHFIIPKPGKKVEVLRADLLTGIFGEGEEPENPGVVHNVEHDEHGMYGFPANIAVGVSWDRLLKNGRVPKGQTADIWHFGLNEIRVTR